MNFPELIRQRRLEMKETQAVFGRRFGVSQDSISHYEIGRIKAPYRVLEFVLNQEKKTFWQRLKALFRN